jgi:selenocysteine lyase/cysteine desulfurase
MDDHETLPVKTTSGYLDTPSMGLPTAAGVQAVREALDAWASGQADYADWEQRMETCRSLFGELAGARPADVGLLGSVVPAVAAVAMTLARGRGTVVAHRAEFRSLLLPVLAHVGEDRMRWVDGPYVADTFAAACDEHTAAVLVSAVSSHDGARPSLSSLAAAAADVDAHLLVDGTQAMGIVVPDAPPDRLGLLACAGYKGLRGPRGTAYAVARPDLVAHVPTPSTYGAADADVRGTYGPPLLLKPGAPGLDQSPAWLSWVGAEPALAQLVAEPAVDREKQVLTLAHRLRDHLGRLGLPTAESDLPSPVVTFAPADPGAVVRALGEAGVRAAARRGRVRLGLHVYNDDRDVDLVAQVLHRCPRSALRDGGDRSGA